MRNELRGGKHEKQNGREAVFAWEVLTVFSFQQTDAEFENLAVPQDRHGNFIADLAILQNIG